MYSHYTIGTFADYSHFEHIQFELTTKPRNNGDRSKFDDFFHYQDSGKSLDYYPDKNSNFHHFFDSLNHLCSSLSNHSENSRLNNLDKYYHIVPLPYTLD